MGFLARPEVLIVLILAFVFFGAKRLPEAGSAIGKTIREFQKSMREVNEPEQPAAVAPPAHPQQLPASTYVAPAAATTVTPAASDVVTEHPATPAQ